MLAVEGLVKRYGATVAVSEASFRVGEGEIFGLLGPNGAGKTTAISVISTLQRPDGGRVRVGGIDVTVDGAGVRRQLGLVPQEIAVYPRLSAWDNLEYFGGIYGLRGRELRGRIEEVLGVVALTEYARRPRAGKFSGGMLRRLNLAAGLLHRPRLLLLDEPTVGVDAQSRSHILDNIRRLNAEHGTTIVYTTHYMEEAEAICGRVAIMDHGQIVACDSVASLVRTLPGTVLEVALSGHYEGFAAAIAAGPGVLDVGARDGRYLVTARDQKAGLSALQRALALNGVMLESLAVHTPNLEQVFLKLTGKSLRDETE